ncbi:hypothetical protein HDU78_003404 [Chytriomyces hyalinus]|nr:hypothetical protein HDU78_003404 [Chytriomyces hyalinus]
MKFAALLTAAAAVSAQLVVEPTCEKLVDNMALPRPANRPVSPSHVDCVCLNNLIDVGSDTGNAQTLNLLGGDYGVDGNSTVAFNFAATDGHVDVTPGYTPGDPLGDADLHPANILANNYFYFKFVWDGQVSSNKFDVNVCQDLTPYQGLYLNVSMPAGSDVYLTLTQKNAACSARTRDSTYVKLSDFHTPNGKPQAFFVPFSLMKFEFDGVTLYDMAHAKDATFVNFNPPNVVYSFYHVGLVNAGDACTPKAAGGASSTGGSVSASVSAPAKTGGATTASAAANGVATTSKSGAASAGVVGSAVALVAGFLMM